MAQPTGPQFDAQATPAEAEDTSAALLAKFDRWDKNLTAHWSEWREQAEFEFAFVAGRQWTEDEEADMLDAQKIPVVFNLVAPAIDAVAGAEIQNRQQVQYFPRQVESTGISDALTSGAEYVTDECSGDQEDSDAFADALVCGIGVTVTRPELDGDQVMIVKDRIDPLQVMVDPASRKRCFEDKRYLKHEIPMSDDEFEDFKEEIGQPDAEGDDGGLSAGKRLTVVNPPTRYTSGMLGGGNGSEDEQIVCRWEWWDKEPAHITAIPMRDGTSKLVTLSPDKHDEAQKAAKEGGIPPLQSKPTTRKVYYYAYVGAGEVLKHGPIPEQAFTYKFITGKRDRNKGTWFGLVRPMMDPAKFTNKLYSEILHIVRTNANGGLMLEEGAVKDIEQFESTYASTDKITWLKDGALSGPNGARMQNKAPPPVQPALFQLMEFARDMVRATTGINDEMLGLVGHDQPGVLEYQRKEAAFGLLSPFFDSLRRYRRDWGKLLLTMMRLYLPADKLIRIVDKGTQQYVQLAETMQAQEYDVIIDDAPSGPNQKAKVMQVLGPMLPQMLQAGIITPQAIADILPYLDIPAAVATKLQEDILQVMQQKQPNPAVMDMQQRAAEADINLKHADAEHKQAQTFKAITQAHVEHANLGAQFLAASQAGAEAPPPEPQQPQGAQPAPVPAAPPQQPPGVQ